MRHEDLDVWCGKAEGFIERLYSEFTKKPVRFGFKVMVVLWVIKKFRKFLMGR